MIEMTQSLYYNIADFCINIRFNNTSENNILLLPSFSPFRCSEERELLFTLLVDDTIKEEPDVSLIRDIDTGNGKTEVSITKDNGYQFIIRNIFGDKCCTLITDSHFSQCKCALFGSNNMRSFGLNDALMLIFAFAGSRKSTLLIHASCVGHNGHAYPFIAKSGTGKSTHSSLWLKHIPDTELINDDNPILRIDDNGIWLYGSPWSGKTPCYRNIKVALGAITKIERSQTNSIQRLNPIMAFANMLPACSSMRWDNDIYNSMCDTITKIIENIPIYTLFCKPDEEAAIICHKAIAK